MRNAIYNIRNNLILFSDGDEILYLIIYPFGLSCARRTNNDKIVRLIKCLMNLLRQLADLQIRHIAEDRTHILRQIGILLPQFIRELVILQRMLQALCFLLILAFIRDKRVIMLLVAHGMLACYFEILNPIFVLDSYNFVFPIKFRSPLFNIRLYQ